MKEVGQTEISTGTPKYYAYVIRSTRFDFLYKGQCEDLDVRLKQHNEGMTKSIRKYIPFEIVYFEAFLSRAEAIAREKYFKSAAGRKYLKSKLAPYFNARPTEP